MASTSGLSTGAQSNPRNRRFGVDTYPHPYFDPSSWYIPPTVKEMYRWCRYLFFTNSTIGPIIRKKASYVITDLIYSTTNPSTKTIWKRLLEKTIRIKDFEFKLLLDLEVYGNAYCSIIYPFDRFLMCPHCEYENLLRTIPWEYNGSHFVGKCKGCGARTSMVAKDRPIRNRSRIKLQRWYPQYIEVMRNPLTDTTKYILTVPKWLKARIKNPKVNKVYVEDTPKEFLDAIRDNKNIEFDSDNIYHMRNESVSQEDDSFGMPPILNVMKDSWLFQTYRRAQEAISLDHILPMTMLSPMSTPGGVSPHMNTDLRRWQSRINNYVTQWRRDQNAIFTVPFPMQVSQIRGDAQALNVHNDMNQVRQNIAGGLDVPQDFIYGGLTWSGANVSLRVLENLLITRLSALNSFLEDWLTPRLCRFLRLTPVKIHHTDFKMADDIQQKQIALGLRQTNTISDQTTIEELGFDYSKEQTRRRDEMEQRMIEMETQQIAQAELQGKISIITAKAQIEIQKMQLAAQSEMQTEQQGQMIPADQQMTQMPPQQAAAPPTGTISDSLPSPMLLDAMANHFLKTTPAHEIDMSLNMMKDSNPLLARAIEDRRKLIGDQAKKVGDPLPEQKPPTRAPDKAVI